MFLNDIKEMREEVDTVTTQDIIEIKNETRNAESELSLLSHCAEIIEDDELEKVLRGIQFTLEQVDSKRAVHLDYIFGVE